MICISFCLKFNLRVKTITYKTKQRTKRQKQILIKINKKTKRVPPLNKHFTHKTLIKQKPHKSHKKKQKTHNTKQNLSRHNKTLKTKQNLRKVKVTRQTESSLDVRQNS